MTKFILVGKAASGKSHLMKKMSARGLRPFVSCTTRPMREGEVNGVDYYFMSDDEFDTLIASGLFWEYKEFNGWKYGTLLSEWQTKDIFIFTPSGAKDISEYERKKCIIIYLDTPREVRYGRLKERSDADTVTRRIQADEEDFAGFSDYDIRISNIF